MLKVSLCLIEIGEGVGEDGRHGNDFGVDRVAPEAAPVWKGDGVAGF